MKKLYTSMLFVLMGVVLNLQAQQADPTHIWEFDDPVVDNKVEGWEIINYDNPNTVGGILHLTATNTGYPDLEYTVTDDEVLDPAISKQIVIRLKNGTSSRRARFYWVKDGVNIRYDFLVTIEDEDFAEYVIDLTHDTRWSGDIESIRFEIPMPVPAGSVGSIVSVDYIKLLEAPISPEAMPSRIPAPFGVNLAGGDFSSDTDYQYPHSAELDYFKSKGLTLIRLPFKWHRLQPEINGPLAEKDLNEIRNFVWEARRRGMWVLLDMHNYGRNKVNGTTYVIGEPELPIESAGDVWRRIAEEFKDFDNIYAYGLMNEPYGMKDHTPWANIAQEMIDAIRSVDTETPIMVGGESYSSADRWQSVSDNLRNLVDPSNDLIFEAHVYFDNDASGSYNQNYDAENATENTGINRLKPFVEWLERYNFRGFIGEYGIPDSDPRWNVVLDKTLAYMKEHHINGTYWAAGSRWGNHHMAVHPYNDLSDRPQMEVLEQYPYADAPPPQPQITSPYVASFNIADVVHYKVTATNNPTNFTVSGLPDGLSFDAATQVISGSISEGSHFIQLSASNDEGVGAVREVELRGVHLRVPGLIEAEDYDGGGQGVGYFDTTVGNSHSRIFYRNDDVDLGDLIDDNYQVTNTADGEWLKYTIDVQEESYYLMKITYKTVVSPIINITIDGEDSSGDIALPFSYPWTEMTFEIPQLSEGFHELKLNVISGGFQLDNFELSIGTAPNNVPTGITAERATGGGSVELSWTVVDGATGYNIKRAEAEAGSYQTIAEDITENTYVDETVEEVTTYYYKISAINRIGEGPDSEIVSSPGVPPLSVHDNELNAGLLKVYPNPSQGQIHVDLLTVQNGEITIQVFNALGVLVYSFEDVKSGAYETTLNLRGKSSGLYYIKTSVGSFSQSRTVIIE